MRKTLMLATAASVLFCQEWTGPEPPAPHKPAKVHLPPMPALPGEPVKIHVPAMPHMPPMPPDVAMLAKGPFMYSPMFQVKIASPDESDREYERGTRALDRRQWDEAVNRFTEAAASSKTRADAALYWKAYALAKLGRNQEATASLDMLAKGHPQSRWLNDAKALGLEIAQAAGKPLRPEEESDNDLKLMAINSLVNSDPERAIPLLENLLRNKTSPQLRERALFVLSQSNSPKALEVVTRAAKGEFNPDLQMKAVQSLGIHGGRRNEKLLADIYSSTSDAAVKRQVLQSYMVAGLRDPVLAAAKGESNPDLRRHAINLLGAMGAGAQLADLYSAESSVENRNQILRAMFATGSRDKLIEIAKTEKEPKLRITAIQQLGTMRSNEAADALTAIYGNSSEAEIKSRVLQAFFVQGNAIKLVEIARKETDPNLKRTAVQQLSHMKSKEATDYMLELLK